MRSILKLCTEMQDKGLLKLDKDFHLMDRSSVIRASGLEPKAPDGARLTAVGPDTKHLRNIIRLGLGELC